MSDEFSAVCPWCGLRRYVNRARTAGPCRSCVGIREVVGSTDWMARARCRGEETELFFDEAMIKSRKFLVFCEACPVRKACGEWAVKNRETYGVWGGLTPMERANAHLKRPKISHTIHNTGEQE